MKSLLFPNIRFIGEDIHPVKESMDAAKMALGEPGLPRVFIWRDAEYEIATILREWKETGPCRNGSKERYVRQNWYEIVTHSGEHMAVYFERRSLKGRVRRGWRIFSMSENGRSKGHSGAGA